MRMRKILVMGLPGAGKTTLATTLAPLLNAVVFNADAVRANISRDLGFGHADRIEHARRMGWICDRVAEAGGTVIADFVCPTEETRAAFGDAFTIWLDRISASRFEDTNRMFVPPKRFDLRVRAEGTPQYWAEQALARLRPSFDPSNVRRLGVAALNAITAGSRTPNPPVSRGATSRFLEPPAARCFTPRIPPRRESASRCRHAI
jgi:hypothetical protein